MKRRRFLKLGMWGGLVLAASGTGLALMPSRRVHLPKQPLQYLDELEFAIVGAIAARVITVEDADPVAIAHGVDGSFEALAPEGRADLKKLLHLIENGLAGLLFDARPSNFTRLSPEGQDAALYAFRDSRLAVRRSGYHAIRKLCAAAYYARESSWPAIGYPGPPQISMPSAPVGQ